jgi:hypothetical protein
MYRSTTMFFGSSKLPLLVTKVYQHVITKSPVKSSKYYSKIRLSSAKFEEVREHMDACELVQEDRSALIAPNTSK